MNEKLFRSAVSDVMSDEGISFIRDVVDVYDKVGVIEEVASDILRSENPLQCLSNHLTVAFAVGFFAAKRSISENNG